MLKKRVKLPEKPEVVDYTLLTNEEVAKLVYNKIIQQSLVETPSAQVLLLAAKILKIGEDLSTEESPLKALSNDELLNKIRNIGGL
jgi:hypothetical protein